VTAESAFNLLGFTMGGNRGAANGQEAPPAGYPTVCMSV
jgi:hypothetical protein